MHYHKMATYIYQGSGSSSLPLIHHFLEATSRFNDDRQIPMTEGVEWGLLHIVKTSHQQRLPLGPLTMIWVGSLPFCDETLGFTHSQGVMANNWDGVNLGLLCIDICKALKRGIGDKKWKDLSKLV